MPSEYSSFPFAFGVAFVQVQTAQCELDGEQRNPLSCRREQHCGFAPERKMRRLICESRTFIVLDKRSCLSLLRRRSIQLLRQAPAQNKTAMLRTARASLKSLEKSSTHEPRVGFRWAAALIPQRLARLRGAFVSRSRHRLRRTADHRTEAERSQGLRY